MEENCGDCYLPQVFNDVVESKIARSKDTQGDEKQVKVKQGLHKRRRSLELNLNCKCTIITP